MPACPLVPLPLPCLPADWLSCFGANLARVLHLRKRPWCFAMACNNSSAGANKHCAVEEPERSWQPESASLARVWCARASFVRTTGERATTDFRDLMRPDPPDPLVVAVKTAGFRGTFLFIDPPNPLVITVATDFRDLLQLVLRIRWWQCFHLVYESLVLFTLKQYTC